MEWEKQCRWVLSKFVWVTGLRHRRPRLQLSLPLTACGRDTEWSHLGGAAPIQLPGSQMKAARAYSCAANVRWYGSFGWPPLMRHKGGRDSNPSTTMGLWVENVDVTQSGIFIEERRSLKYFHIINTYLHWQYKLWLNSSSQMLDEPWVSSFHHLMGHHILLQRTLYMNR